MEARPSDPESDASSNSSAVIDGGINVPGNGDASKDLPGVLTSRNSEKEREDPIGPSAVSCEGGNDEERFGSATSAWTLVRLRLYLFTHSGNVSALLVTIACFFINPGGASPIRRCQ